MNLRVLAILALLAIQLSSVRAQPYAQNVTRAEAYLVNHFNPSISLIYESEDPGQHWLRNEQPGYYWKYDQTYWLYSDNLLAFFALRHDYPEISTRIRNAIDSYSQPPSQLFEVISGEHIPLPMRNAQDFIVAQKQDHVVMIRRHNATSIALGVYADFWMYLALERALERDPFTAVSLVHNAETLWRGNGVWDWSFTIYDHMFSNQKLALLLFTARALGVRLEHESEMEAHLWSMQNTDGGVASLSYPTGEKAGSANAETTALSILIYDQNLLAKFPKLEQSRNPQSDLFAVSILVAAAAFLVLIMKLRGRVLRSLRPSDHSARQKRIVG